MTNAEDVAAATVAGSATAGTETAGSRRLIWKLALPVPLLLLIAVLGIWLALPRMITQNAYNDVVRSATQTVAQFKTLRAYYTDNVIAKVIASGALKPSFDHKDKPGIVPLPATMIHDLSALLGTAGTRINLYSDYPFPNRAGRILDGFQREAWAHLTRSPDATFVRRETRDGSEVVRVAIADRMSVAACVNCHNSHAASPKTDWKLGDVRGVLEVATVIDAQIAEGDRLAGHLTLGIVLIGVVLAVVCVATARGITAPLGRMTGVMRRLADGDHAVAIPDMDRRDEIAAMAQTVQGQHDRDRAPARPPGGPENPGGCRAQGRAYTAGGRLRGEREGHRRHAFVVGVGHAGLGTGPVRGIGRTVGEVSEIATSLASAIEQQGAATLEISRNAQQAAQGTADVSSSIAEVLGVSDELSHKAAALRTEVDRFLATIRTV